MHALRLDRGLAATAPSLISPASTDDELDLHAGDRSFVMSFARGVSVIQAFANTTRPLSIAEISHRVHIPRAAVRRLLHTLAELGYVKLVEARYVLTPKTLELGNAFASSNALAIEMQPTVIRLADQLHSFCALSILEGDETMLVCVAGTAHTGVVRQRTPGAGSKAPLYASASGLLFLSSFTEAQLDAYFSRVSMQPLTFRTQTAPGQVRDALRRIRAQGHAVCDRTLVDHLRSVAVPVHDRCGAMVAAMVAVVIDERLVEDGLESTLLPALRLGAKEASLAWR